MASIVLSEHVEVETMSQKQVESLLKHLDRAHSITRGLVVKAASLDDKVAMARRAERIEMARLVVLGLFYALQDGEFTPPSKTA